MKENSKISQNWQLPKWEDLVSNYQKGMAILIAYNNIVKEHEEILIKYGWPPFARTYTDDMRYVISLHNQYTNQEDLFIRLLENYFIERLKKDNFSYLEKSLSEWSTVDILQKRIKTLNEIIIAHKMGLYSLSVPVSIIQIEGIIAEYYNHSGRINYKNNKKYFEKLFSLNRGKVAFKSADEFIKMKLYEDFSWGDGIMHDISRHSIIHGNDVNYATEINSVRMLYLLDFIIYVACILKKEVA